LGYLIKLVTCLFVLVIEPGAGRAGRPRLLPGSGGHRAGTATPGRRCRWSGRSRGQRRPAVAAAATAPGLRRGRKHQPAAT